MNRRRPVCECCGTVYNLDVVEITQPQRDKSGYMIEDCRENNLILLCSRCEKKLNENKSEVLMHLKYSNYHSPQEDPRVRRYCSGWAAMR